MYIYSVIDDSTLSFAISDAINAIFIQKQIHFDIIIYGQKTFHIMDILDGIGSSKNKTLTRQIYISDWRKWNHKLKKSAVVLLPDYNHWLKFCNLTELDNEFQEPLRFLIYYVDSQFQDFHLIPFNLLFIPWTLLTIG